MPNATNKSMSQERARRIAEECYADVLAYCRRHAPAGCDAADLAQETFLRFVRNGRYRERGKPLSYLMRTARSVCVDASRERRLETVSLDFDVAAEEEPEDLPDLGAAVAGLPDDLREVVELRFGAGLSVNEVARVLGTNRFTVGRRVRRALELLRRGLEEGGLDG